MFVLAILVLVCKQLFINDVLLYMKLIGVLCHVVDLFFLTSVVIVKVIIVKRVIKKSLQ